MAFHPFDESSLGILNTESEAERISTYLGISVRSSQEACIEETMKTELCKEKYDSTSIEKEVGTQKFKISKILNSNLLVCNFQCRN